MKILSAKNICLIPSYDFRFTTRSSLYYHMKELHNAAVTLPGQNQSQQFRCVIESCQQKFDTGAELGNHVTLSHALEMAAANATSIDSTDCGQRVSTGSQEPNDDCGDVDAAAAAAGQDAEAAAAEETPEEQAQSAAVQAVIAGIFT